MREVMTTPILKGFDQKTAFFEGWSWFKFNNSALALGANLKFDTKVPKGLQLKVRKFWGLVLTLLEVTGKKMEGVGRGGIFFPPPPILNRVKIFFSFFISFTSIIFLKFSIVSLFYPRKHCLSVSKWFAVLVSIYLLLFFFAC